MQGVGLQDVEAYDLQSVQCDLPGHNRVEACQFEQHMNMHNAGPNHGLYAPSQSENLAACSSASYDRTYSVLLDPPPSDRLQSDSNTPREQPDSRRLDPGVTTLVVRNVPARYTKEELLQEWPPDGTFDFFYLPFNRIQKRAAGYCFVNFTSHEAAVTFHNQWHSKSLAASQRTGKKLSIGAAEFQGLEANLRHLMRCGIQRVRNTKYLPSVFNGDHEMPFTEQTSSDILLALRTGGPLSQIVDGSA